MINSKVKPDAKLDNWELYLLGFVSENVRKAIIFNILTKEELPAKVLVDQKPKETKYSVIEAVDQAKNTLVDFTRTFVVKIK